MGEINANPFSSILCRECRNGGEANAQGSGKGQIHYMMPRPEHLPTNGLSISIEKRGKAGRGSMERALLGRNHFSKRFGVEQSLRSRTNSSPILEHCFLI